MVSSSLRPDCNCRIRQAFNNVPDLEIVLTVSVLREPPRSYSVHSIAAHEWIIQAFGDFVAERSYIFETRTEQPGADPTGKIEYVSLLAKPVRGIAGFKVVSMKSEHAALVGIVTEIEKRIGEQERGDIFGCDLASMLGRAYRG